MPQYLSPALWSLSADRVLVWILVGVRFAGLLSVLPGLGQERIPMRIRVVLVIFTAVLISPLVKLPSPAPKGMWDLIPVMVTELLAGLLMGLVVACVMEAVAFAAQLMDIQMGFSFVQILDPGTNQNTSVSGSILLQMTVLFLFLSGLHHHMILALAESFRILPVGAAIPLHPLEVVGTMGQLFIRGLQLAMPVLITLFFVDVLQGVAAKLLPQLQLIQLAFPLKIAIGLAVFAILMREFTAWLVPLFERVPAEALQFLR